MNLNKETSELDIDELETVAGGIGVEAETLTPVQQRAHYDHRGGPLRFEKQT